MNALNSFLFVALPYIAIVTCVIGSIQRYRTTGFKVSSLSSQFLEGRQLYFGSMAFHWGLLAVFTGHLVTALFPSATLMWNSSPVRLIVLEVLAFSFGVSVLIGLARLFFRRISNPRVKIVTSRMDLLLEILLLSQVILGCWIALGYRWGSSWFASDLSPYLWSIATLDPKIDAISAMPTVIKAHIVGAFVLLGMIPFTRLVHFLVAPLHYIGRPLQVVMWTWDRKRVRDPNTVWTHRRPTNT